MKYEKIYDDPVTVAVVFDPGDDVLEGLRGVSRREKITAAYFTGIGALSDVVLGYFDRGVNEYRRNVFNEQVEVVSLSGVVALRDDEPLVHAHIVVGRSNGDAKGGHLLEGHVWPTLEVVLTESPAHLQRKFDPVTGLALIDLRGDSGGRGGKSVGSRRWAIPEGYIPGKSTGPSPQMTSHETACILNAGDVEANLSIMVFFADRDPVGPYCIKVPPRRTLHLRFNDLQAPEPVPVDTDYSSLIESDVPIVVQHTRLDSRQAENALMTTLAYPCN